MSRANGSSKELVGLGVPGQVESSAGHGQIIALGRPGPRQNRTVHIPAKVDYGIRALLSLAVAGVPQTAEALAGDQGLPPRFLGAILADLRRAGLVASQRGADGGYRLSRPAAEIWLAEVIRALDGPLAEARLPTRGRPLRGVLRAPPRGVGGGAGQSSGRLGERVPGPRRLGKAAPAGGPAHGRPRLLGPPLTRVVPADRSTRRAGRGRLRATAGWRTRDRCRSG